MDDEPDTTCPGCGAPAHACCTTTRRELTTERDDARHLRNLAEWARDNYRNDLRAAEDALAIAVGALRDIANEDYRGNRPTEQGIAYSALRRIGATP